MNEAGIDISGQSSKHLDDYIGKIEFDYLLQSAGTLMNVAPTSQGWNPDALAV